jgi:hypothetical protein
MVFKGADEIVEARGNGQNLGRRLRHGPGPRRLSATGHQPRHERGVNDQPAPTDARRLDFSRGDRLSDQGMAKPGEPLGFFDRYGEGVWFGARKT